jgi:hypothetical protein
MSDPIPLSVLMLEPVIATHWGADIHGTSPQALEHRIREAGHQVITDYVGRKAVSRDVARLLFDEALAAQTIRAEAEQTLRAEAARRVDPVARRIAAVQSKYAARRAAGLAPLDNAFEEMIIDDDQAEREASTVMADYLGRTGSGERYHYTNQEGQGR